MLGRRRRTAAAVRMEQLLDWLDAMAGREAVLAPLDTVSGRAPITSVRYPDVPEPGSMVAATLGLSLGMDEAGPELVLLVASVDPAWAFALAYAASRVQPEVEGVMEGSTINMEAPFAEGSEMVAFVLVGPFLLPEGESGVVHTSAGHVRLLQAIPLHRAELDVLRAINGEARSNEINNMFQAMGDEVSDPARPSTR